MNKPVSRNLHGLIDYQYAAIVSTAPEVIGFKNDKAATNLCRVLGGGAVLYSFFTKYEWGVVPLIPFKGHLAVDFAANLFALSAPWLFSFSENTKARNTFLVTGVAGLAVTLLTRQEEMEADD